MGISRRPAADVILCFAVNITQVIPKEAFKVFIRFENGTEGVVDLSSLAGRGVFAIWFEPGVFEQVRVGDAGGIEWPGQLDLCPDALYLQLTGKLPEGFIPSLSKIPTHA